MTFARPLGSAVVLRAGPALGRRDSRTHFPGVLAAARREPRGRDWLESRPHAEELKEQLCCDRGRAARPGELGGRGAGGGRVLGGEGRAGLEEESGSGSRWRGLRGRRKGARRTADGGVWEARGRRARRLRALTARATSVSREEPGRKVRRLPKCGAPRRGEPEMGPPRSGRAWSQLEVLKEGFKVKQAVGVGTQARGKRCQDDQSGRSRNGMRHPGQVGTG